MIFKALFFSAAAYMAYRYIGSSNAKAKELNDARRGTVEILPPDPDVAKPSATETLRESRQTALISSAAEDLSRRY
jgi:hypothetical protein